MFTPRVLSDGRTDDVGWCPAQWYQISYEQLTVKMNTFTQLSSPDE